MYHTINIETLRQRLNSPQAVEEGFKLHPEDSNCASTMDKSNDISW